MRPATRLSYLAQQHGILGSPVALKLSDIELGTWDKDTKTFTVMAQDQEASADCVSYGSDFGPTDPPWLIDMGQVGAADI